MVSFKAIDDEVDQALYSIDSGTVFPESILKFILFLWDSFYELPEKYVEFVVKAVKDMASEGYLLWVYHIFLDTIRVQSTKPVRLPLLIPERNIPRLKVQEVIDELLNKNILVSLNCGYFG